MPVSAKGLQGLNNQIQPVTGPASIQSALQALSPEDQALVAQGIDPFGGDQGMMAGQPVAGQPMAVPQGLSPETRMAMGEMLNQMLSSFGQPTNEADAAAMTSIQNALQALSMGNQQGR